MEPELPASIQLPMKAILIDPTQNQVSEVECDGTWQSITAALDVELLTTVAISDTEMLYLDDLGLLTYPNPNGYFRFLGASNIFAGKGLILGIDSFGEAISTGLTVKQVHERVEFCEPSEEEVAPKCHFLAW